MRQQCRGRHPEIGDYGWEPMILPIRHAAIRNENFRTVLWTGRYLQLTLMSIPAGGDIGVEMHPDVDQFIRIESGRATVCMGNCPDDLREVGCVDGGDALLIPAGTWHNVVNRGNRPLKLYSVYAPPQHPRGTVHETKCDAEREDHAP